MKKESEHGLIFASTSDFNRVKGTLSAIVTGEDLKRINRRTEPQTEANRTAYKQSDEILARKYYGVPIL